MATTLPDGWKLGQLKAEQPTTNYPEFKREILGEIGRVLQVPVNVITGDSSQHNYASGRLDHQTYHRAIRIEQDHCVTVVLSRVFASWYQEYRLLSSGNGFLEAARTKYPSHLSFSVDTTSNTPFSEGKRGTEWKKPIFGSKTPEHYSIGWFWDGFEHVDPAKEASAQEKRLANKTTSLATEYARTGRDWEEELRQIARERELMTELGLEPIPTAVAPQPSSQNSEEDNEQ